MAASVARYVALATHYAAEQTALERGIEARGARYTGLAEYYTPLPLHKVASLLILGRIL